MVSYNPNMNTTKLIKAHLWLPPTCPLGILWQPLPVTPVSLSDLHSMPNQKVMHDSSSPHMNCTFRRECFNPKIGL